MSDSYLDRLPGHEREKIRKRLRSPEEFERLREKVKGPEDLEREMERSERLAELHLALESEPRMNERLKSTLERDIAEQGIDNVLDTDKCSPDAKAAIEQGRFDVSVDEDPQTHNDALVVVTEGNVREKVPVKLSFSDAYSEQLLKRG